MDLAPIESPLTLGHLKRISLRDLWSSEPLEFTPWLADNLTLLGGVLGMDLELQIQEAPVGTFSLDLLAHDLARDHSVVIENQLGPTDHDHLGKLITYAAGYDAAVAIWIAADFRDEHRQAIDWLNQRSDTKTEFFGIVVEALQIDDSKPACNFRLVAFPNDWQKTKVTSATQVPSPRGEAYREFFQDLIDRLRTKHQFTQARKGQPQNWYSFSAGIRGIVYSVVFSQGNRVRAEVYIDGRDATWNKWLFDSLYARRDEIEAAFGEPLEWERLDSKKASRIAVYRSGSIDDSVQELEAIKTWSIEQLLHLKKVIAPRVAKTISSADRAKPTGKLTQR